MLAAVILKLSLKMPNFVNIVIQKYPLFFCSCTQKVVEYLLTSLQ